MDGPAKAELAAQASTRRALLDPQPAAEVELFDQGQVLAALRAKEDAGFEQRDERLYPNATGKDNSVRHSTIVTCSAKVP